MDDLNAMPSSIEDSISNNNSVNSTTLVMTPEAGEFSYEDYIIAGWTDEQLFKKGFAVYQSESPASEITSINYTLVKQPGTRCSKQQMQDGSFKTASTIFDGTAETRTGNLKSIKTTLEGMGKDECLILGTTEQPSFRIISRDQKEKGKEGITRSKDNFRYKDKPTLMMIDVDYKQCPYIVENPVEVIQRVVDNPFGCVVRSSTSANIIDPEGKPITDSKGCHIYVVVENGTKIPDILKTIHNRLLMAGYGFVFVSESGTAQVRTFIDVCVGSPERIIYEADPILLERFTQERTTQYFPGNMLSIRELTEDD